MEGLYETFSAVTMPEKCSRLKKSYMRSQNKQTIYSAQFFKDISEQHKHYSHITAMTLSNIKPCTAFSQIHTTL
jgi:hypothetical protein